MLFEFQQTLRPCATPPTTDALFAHHQDDKIAMDSSPNRHSGLGATPRTQDGYWLITKMIKSPWIRVPTDTPALCHTSHPRRLLAHHQDDKSALGFACVRYTNIKVQRHNV